MSLGDRSTITPLIEPLTRRERDILALLAQENSAPEIAEQLTLAVSSVKWYIQQVYGKLGVNSKRQALTRARELGLVEAPAGLAPQLVSSTPPIVSPPPAPERKHNLPVQTTRFFGREDELTQLIQRLADNRLVTLTGSGGVGKTRLSLQAAARVIDQFPGGVWLVELAPLADPALVPQHVAAALGVRENPDRSVMENLAAFLRALNLLLVLDNCEHLLEASAQLAEALLRAAPGLKVLASSREPLNIAGEAVYGVRSLPFPNPAQLPPLESLREYSAISLFVDRARLVLPDYQVAERNAAAIASICQRLDGIPLAIEMAAARVNVLNAAALAGRLDDAFRVLTGGSRTALPRQQTLRAMIDWSYDLLSGPERLLLQRLSVFAGGCTLEAAEVICADTAESAPEPAAPKIGEAEILELVSSLVSKSMVIADRIPGAETRYHLLETVRQYAREKLHAVGEGDRLRARHLHFFLQFAQEAEPELRGPDQIAWLDRLQADLDNFRSALEYSQSAGTSAEAEAGLQLAVPLVVFWEVRGHGREIGAWLEAALARRNVPDRSLVRAEALNAVVSMVWVTSEMFDTLGAAAESVEIFREAGAAGQRGLAYALLTLGQRRHGRGDGGAKLALFEESAALFRELGDKWGLAWALHTLANTMDPLVNYQAHGAEGAPAPLPEREPSARNDHSAEHALFEESLALFRELGDRVAQGQVLGSMGNMYFCWGRRADGQATYEEFMQIDREFGNVLANGWSLIHLSRDALAHDELDRALALIIEGHAIERAEGMKEDESLGHFLRAEIARRQGDLEQAGLHLAKAVAWTQRMGGSEPIASTLDGQGRIARSAGDYAAAHALHRQALEMRRYVGNPIGLAHSFHALALLAAEREDQAERAARLLGAARPFDAALYNFHYLLPIWRAEHERATSLVRSHLGEARAAALMAEGEAMTLEEAFTYALES